MSKLLSQSSYNSNVKLRDISSRMLLLGSHEYNSSLRLSSVVAKRNVVLTAKLNELTLNKIDCLFYLESQTSGQKLSVGVPTFKLYFVNEDYSDVFVAEQNGVLTTNGWQTSLDISLLVPNFIEGQAALKLQVSTDRIGDKITKTVYVNHLGIYDSIIRLRNDLDFLDITKLDE